MPSIASLMVLAAMLFVKHLIADGPLQTRYQVANKGRFLHPGGLLHAGTHAALTALCLAIWAGASGVDASAAAPLFAGVVGLEFVVHYLVDWTKCQTERRFDWSARATDPSGRPVLQIYSPMYFIAFLADQTAHSLTYVGIVYLVGAQA